jgi:hypothetical protein
MSILLAMKILLHEHLDVRASSLYVRACVRHEHLATFGPSGCWLQWSHRQCVSDVCLYTYLYIYDVCLYTYVYHIYSLHADQPVQGHVARTRLPRCTCEIPRCSHELQVPIRARSLSLLSRLSLFPSCCLLLLLLLLLLLCPLFSQRCSTPPRCGRKRSGTVPRPRRHLLFPSDEVGPSSSTVMSVLTQVRRPRRGRGPSSFAHFYGCPPSRQGQLLSGSLVFVCRVVSALGVLKGGNL